VLWLTQVESSLHGKTEYGRENGKLPLGTPQAITYLRDAVSQRNQIETEKYSHNGMSYLPCLAFDLLLLK
jgi:hypothetical protein